MCHLATIILISIHIAQSGFIQAFSPLFTHTQLHKTVGNRENCVKVFPSAGTALEYACSSSRTCSNKEWFMSFFSRNSILSYFVIR